MLKNILQQRHIILASGSPRRAAILQDLDIDFEIRLKEVDESYPKELKGKNISEYLAKLKASPFIDELKKNEILITADTIVWLDGQALGKPTDATQAKEMLRSISGKTHEVISSVALTTTDKQTIISDITKVIFKELSDKEIDYYIEKYKPFDKAGAYGIQEWLGFIGIERIEGSYLNVVGFPVQKFYEALHQI